MLSRAVVQDAVTLIFLNTLLRSSTGTGGDELNDTADFFSSEFSEELLADVSEELNYRYIKSLCTINQTTMSFYDLMACVEDLAEKTGPRNKFELLTALFYTARRHGQLKSCQLEDVSSKIKGVDLIILRKDSTRLIIEVKLGKTTKGSGFRALKHILDSKCYLAGEGLIARDQIFIGLLVNKLGVCHLSYLYNSRDIRDAVNVSLPRVCVLPAKKRTQKSKIFWKRRQGYWPRRRWFKPRYWTAAQKRKYILSKIRDSYAKKRAANLSKPLFPGGNATK